MLLFAPGQRPSAAAIAALCAPGAPGARAFQVSFMPAPGEGWVELLANGLTFDLVGLAPGAGESAGPTVSAYGFSGPPPVPGEAIGLFAGAHLAGGENLLPVVRVMAGLAAALAKLPGIQAIVWTPAAAMMEINYFERSFANWLNGGVVPVLGLISLLRGNKGEIHSQGLNFFTGHEVEITPSRPENLSVAGKFAIRLIHALLEGAIGQLPEQMTGVQGEHWALERSGDRRLLRVWQKD